MKRTLYRDAALADGRSAGLQVGLSVLVESGRIAWIRPVDAELDPGPADDLEIVDAAGATLVPGMVDGHSHLTLPGGAHWIDHGFDDTRALRGDGGAQRAADERRGYPRGRAQRLLSRPWRPFERSGLSLAGMEDRLPDVAGGLIG